MDIETILVSQFAMCFLLALACPEYFIAIRKQPREITVLEFAVFVLTMPVAIVFVLIFYGVEKVSSFLHRKFKCNSVWNIKPFKKRS